MMFSMANTTTQNAKRIDCLPFVFRTKLFNFVFIVKILIIQYLDNFMTLQNCYEFMQSFAFVAAGFHTCFTTVCSRHIFLLSFPELAQLSAFFVFSHILTMSLFSGKDVTHSSSYSQLINVTYNVSFVLKHNSRESYNFVSTAA